jgi:hypothetical protein
MEGGGGGKLCLGPNTHTPGLSAQTVSWAQHTHPHTPGSLPPPHLPTFTRPPRPPHPPSSLDLSEAHHGGSAPWGQHHHRRQLATVAADLHSALQALAHCASFNPPLGGQLGARGEQASGQEQGQGRAPGLRVVAGEGREGAALMSMPAPPPPPQLQARPSMSGVVGGALGLAGLVPGALAQAAGVGGWGGGGGGGGVGAASPTAASGAAAAAASALVAAAGAAAGLVSSVATATAAVATVATGEPGYQQGLLEGYGPPAHHQPAHHPHQGQRHGEPGEAADYGEPLTLKRMSGWRRYSPLGSRPGQLLSALSPVGHLLRNLALRGLTLGSRDLAALAASAPALRRLELRDCGFDDARSALPQLLQLLQLRVLRFVGGALGLSAGALVALVSELAHRRPSASFKLEVDGHSLTRVDRMQLRHSVEDLGVPMPRLELQLHLESHSHREEDLIEPCAIC